MSGSTSPPAPGPRPGEPGRGTAVLIAAVLGAALVICAVLIGGALVLRTGTDQSSQPGPRDPAVTGLKRFAPAQRRESMLDFAKQAIVSVLARSSTSYDADVERAVELMTPSFARTFGDLSDSIRAGVLDGDVVITPQVTGLGVVEADGESGRLLVFVDEKTTMGDAAPQVSPIYAVLTVVASTRPGTAWLLDDIETTGTQSVAETAPRRREVLEAASDVAGAFVNIDHRTVSVDIAQIRALATGKFRRDFDSTVAKVRSAVVTNGSVMTGEVVAAGLVSMGEDSATVIVATSGQVTNAATRGKVVSRTFRLSISLSRQDGHWLAQRLDSV